MTALGDYSQYLGKTMPSGITILRMVSENAHRCAKVVCRCSCGREFQPRIKPVLDGNTKSCGCKARSRRPSQGRVLYSRDNPINTENGLDRP